MKVTNTVFLSLLIAAGSWLTPDAYAQGVKVNGREIPQSRIDLVVKNQIAQGRPDSPELRSAVREDLINRELIAQEAVRQGYDKKPEVVQQMTMVRQDVLANAYLQDYLQSHPLSDEALKKEYDLVRSQLGNREFKARHILVEKEDEAKEIIAQIRKGGSFDKIAANRSRDASNKDKGGELDWITPASPIARPFLEALMKMKKGQLTEAPVQTQFGWHVIRLDDDRAYTAPSFEQVKPNLQRTMQQQLVQKALADLRGKAKIE